MYLFCKRKNILNLDEKEVQHQITLPSDEAKGPIESHQETIQKVSKHLDSQPKPELLFIRARTGLRKMSQSPATTGKVTCESVNPVLKSSKVLATAEGKTASRFQGCLTRPLNDAGLLTRVSRRSISMMERKIKKEESMPSGEERVPWRSEYKKLTILNGQQDKSVMLTSTPDSRLTLKPSELDLYLERVPREGAKGNLLEELEKGDNSINRTNVETTGDTLHSKPALNLELAAAHIQQLAPRKLQEENMDIKRDLQEEVGNDKSRIQMRSSSRSYHNSRVPAKQEHNAGSVKQYITNKENYRLKLFPKPVS